MKESCGYCSQVNCPSSSSPESCSLFTYLQGGHGKHCSNGLLMVASLYPLRLPLIVTGRETTSISLRNTNQCDFVWKLKYFSYSCLPAELHKNMYKLIALVFQCACDDTNHTFSLFAMRKEWELEGRLCASYFCDTAGVVISECKCSLRLKSLVLGPVLLAPTGSKSCIIQQCEHANAKYRAVVPKTGEQPCIDLQ